MFVARLLQRAIIYYIENERTFFSSLYGVLQLWQITGTSFIFIVHYIMPDFRYIY